MHRRTPLGGRNPAQGRTLAEELDMQLAQWDVASGTDFHAEARAVVRSTFRSGRSVAAVNRPLLDTE